MATAAARRTWDFDILLGGAALIVAATAAWVLIADIPLFVRDDIVVAERPVAGKVQSKEHEVRRRAADLPLWDDAATGDELHVSDQVFTDAASTASLQLLDGTMLELGEHTLIAMERAEDRAVLNVIKGSVRATTPRDGEPVAIRIAGQETVIRPNAASEVQITVKPGKAPEVVVLRGESQIGAERVTTAQKAVLDSGKIAVFAAPPLIASPEPDAAAAPAATVEPVVTPAQSAPKAPSLPKQMKVLIPYAPPVSPRGRLIQWAWQVLEETAYAGEEGAKVTWDAVADADGYDVEVARDKDFRDVVLHEQVAVPELRVGKLPPGSYFLRIATRSKDGRISAPSEPAELVIAQKAPKPAPSKALVPPVLLSPADGADLRLEGLMPVVSFAWEPAPKAATYVLQVLAEDGSVVFEKRTRGQDASAEVKPGRYTWRVRSLRSRDDPGGPWADALRFSVTHVVPEALQPKAPEPPAPEPPPPDLTPLKEPWLELRIAHAPSSYRYEATEADPETRIRARLFNSVVGDATAWATPWLGLDVAGSRHATTIFKKQESDIPDQQSSQKVKPVALTTGAKLRVAGDPSAYLDVTVGQIRKDVSLFERSGDGTLSAKQTRAVGPAFGLGLGVMLQELRVRGVASFARVKSKNSGDVTSGTLTSFEATAGWLLVDDWLNISFGARVERDRLNLAPSETPRATKVSVDVGSLLWGVDIGL